MNFNEYTKLSERTDNKLLTIEERVTNYSLSMCEEVGEIISLLKKYWWHDHTLDIEELMKEFGDCFWYISQIKRLNDFTFYEVNINKDSFERKQDALEALVVESGYYMHLKTNYELNRVYWTLRAFLEMFDIKFAMVLERNIAKLEKRYPEKFNSVDSVKRVDIVG